MRDLFDSMLQRINDVCYEEGISTARLLDNIGDIFEEGLLRNQLEGRIYEYLSTKSPSPLCYEKLDRLISNLRLDDI